MSFEKGIKKEEVDVEKEERWLIREIQFLEHFRENIQEIFKLQQKVSALQKSAEAGKSRNIQKKLQTIQEFIERDEHKFKKFRRVLSRGERRRIRYEKRVLGRIATLEESLDKPEKKELEALIEQIHVYSARILTELSWRVGKITELTSHKTANLPQIKGHIDATLQASKALVVLLESLEKFMQAVENKIGEKKLIRPILPQVAGLTGYLREGVIKTAHVKSVPEIKDFLENKPSRANLLPVDKEPKQQQYAELIDRHIEFLRKVLSAKDIGQLKNIDYNVHLKATLLFLPNFKKPILGFNLDNIPRFSVPGWIFHAVPGENLRKITKKGFLSSPLEIVLEKKNYYSWRFWRHTSPVKRLVDGISLSFQDYKKYQAYLTGQESRREVGGRVGGFFIFPMKDILQEGLILDFKGTMDGYPEITLRDPAYQKFDATIVNECLVALRKSLNVWLAKLNEIERFFAECKKNIKFLTKMVKFFDTYEYISIFKRGNQVSFQGLKPGANQPEQIFIGKGFFYEDFINLDLTMGKNLLKNLIEYSQEDNFFQFLLLVAHWTHEDLALLPPLKRAALRNVPSYLNGTIFQSGMDYFNEENLIEMKKKGGVSFPSMLLILTLMKWKPHLFKSKGTVSTQDYLNYVKKMSPRQLRKLLQRTVKELAFSLVIIIKKRFRTSKPCMVDIANGIVFLNQGYNDSDTLQKLVRKGVVIFSEFSFEYNEQWGSDRFFNENELDFFFQGVLPLKNLFGGKKFSNLETYFYLKGEKMVAHMRRNGRELTIS